MAKRKKPTEAPLGKLIETRNHKFGWCTTGQHEGCSQRSQWYERVYLCSCNCHTQEKKGKK